MSKKQTEAALKKLLDAAKEQISVGETYQHYRGNLYKVLDIGIFTEDATEVGVVYQAQYGQRLVFIRPLKMWNEVVEFEGKSVRRFRKV